MGSAGQQHLQPLQHSQLCWAGRNDGGHWMGQGQGLACTLTATFHCEVQGKEQNKRREQVMGLWLLPYLAQSAWSSLQQCLKGCEPHTGRCLHPLGRLGRDGAAHWGAPSAQALRGMKGRMGQYSHASMWMDGVQGLLPTLPGDTPGNGSSNHCTHPGQELGGPFTVSPSTLLGDPQPTTPNPPPGKGCRQHGLCQPQQAPSHLQQCQHHPSAR